MLFPVLRQWLSGGEPVERHDPLEYLNFGGNSYPLTGQTWSADKAESIGYEFVNLIDGALKANGVVSAIEQTRFMVFAEARFLFQKFNSGRPGELWPNESLGVLERPWPGGTTGDMLSRMLLDADFAGNSYWVRNGGELVRLRPDWVDIVLEERTDDAGRRIGLRRRGYLYYEGGRPTNNSPAAFLPGEVCHFAPYPDPSASYKGMSWLTPVVREIQADIQATKHKLKFFENAATPNLHVGMKDMTKEKFKEFVALMKEQHDGVENAYKTLYTANGADVTVLGANFQQMDFKATQGAGETRLAAAAGVHPVIIGLSEGMQGSSLNAGNYQAAKRVFTDRTIRPLWRNAAASLEVLVPSASGSRLWYDDRDVPFLREDIQDRANVQQTDAITIRNLIDAGYEPTSVVSAVTSEDMSLLKHSGLFSVQLQEAGTTPPVPEAPRTEVTIADGAIRSEVHAAPVEFHDGAIQTDVNASQHDPDAVNAVVERATQMSEERDSALVDAFRGIADDMASRMEASNQAVIDEMSRPKQTLKTVETDEIGRILSVIEETQ